MQDADWLSRLKAALADRYRIEREVGRGGTAVVYLAEDLKHARQVAIKTLRPELAAYIGEERFLREIAVAAKLSHPHILPLYDSGNADGVLYHVTPYVAGESLRARLDRERQLGVEEALRITREIADALAYAHDLGIVHRDIKPGNVLLEAGHAVVTDFGIACALSTVDGERLTASGIALGTPAYMSPEQAAGEWPIDARTDVYALASMLYEMLAGEAPFTGPNAQVILARKSVANPPRLRVVRDSVPAGVEAAVLRALARVPADRFPSARAFGEALVTSGGGTTLPSIAVLPFASIGAGADNEEFADGITEDVITQLAKIRALKVISRTSVLPFRNPDRNLREIAARLGVSTVLEGTIRRVGDRIRVVAQLIDAETDAHLWADTYDRRLTDILAIQSEVALRIAEALEAEISPTETTRIRKKPTADVEAYHLYLKGRHSTWLITEDGVRRGLKYYEAAIARDPSYALAYAGLGYAYVLAAMGYAGSAIPTVEAYRRSTGAVARALEFDPELGQAHTLLGWIKFVFQFAWSEAERELVRGRDLDPGHNLGLALTGLMMSALERWDEALDLHRRARDIDPLAPVHASDIASTLLRAGRVGEALTEAASLVEFHPEYPLGHSVLGWAHVLTGEYEPGLRELWCAVSLAPHNTMLEAQLGEAYAMSGDAGEARAILRKLETSPDGRHIQPYHKAYVHTGLGELDAAIDCLEQALAEHAGGLYGVKGSFLFRPLHGHPRFVGLLRKMNLA